MHAVHRRLVREIVSSECYYIKRTDGNKEGLGYAMYNTIIISQAIRIAMQSILSGKMMNTTCNKDTSMTSYPIVQQLP